MSDAQKFSENETSLFPELIVYINLDKRSDRRYRCEKQFAEYQLVVERFAAIFDTRQGFGCLSSHLGILRQAKMKGVREVLIFEDDIEFLVTPADFWSCLLEIRERTDNYDVVMLSYHLREMSDEMPRGRLSRVQRCETASAYLVKNSYFDTLIKFFEDLLIITKYVYFPLDQAWSELQKRDRWLYFTERLGKQRAGFSDNEGRYIDYGF